MLQQRNSKRQQIAGIAASLVFLAAAGCVGSILEPGEGSGDDQDDSAGASADLTCKDLAQPLDPGPAPLRRLSVGELERTLSTLVAVNVPKTLLDSLPADGIVDGFENNADAQRFSERHFDALLAIGRFVAQNLDLSQWLSCPLADASGVKDLACHQALIDQLGAAFFRRPVREAERARLLSLAQDELMWTDPDPEASAQQIVTALVMSPQFLFAVEESREADSERPELIPLSGVEVATRLALMLWSEAPDAALLARAETGELASAEGVRSVAAEMLADPRSRFTRHDFAETWLRLREMDFPVDDPALASLPQDSQAELRLLIDDYFFGDANVLDIFKADHFYANATLGTIYGVNAASADQFERFSADDSRGGLFTTSVYLMRTSHPSKPSITMRGHFLRAAILCSPPPPPPPALNFDINNINEDQHASDPSCATCHQLMDPIGRGLSRYDQLGRLTDDFVSGVSKQGDFYLDDSVTPFSGGRELGQIVAGLEQTSRCIVKRTLQASLGRSLVSSDGCTLERMHASFSKSEFRYEALALELVSSDVFRFKKAPTNP